MRALHVAGALSLLVVAISAAAPLTALPFRPGLSLGAVVSPALLSAVAKEAAVKGELATLRQAGNDADRLLAEIKADTDALLRQDAPTTPETAAANEDEAAELALAAAEVKTVQRAVRRKRTKALGSLVHMLANTVNGIGGGKSAKSTDEIPSLGSSSGGFASSHASPVNWQASSVVHAPRGSDTFNVDVSIVDAATASGDQTHARRTAHRWREERRRGERQHFAPATEEELSASIEAKVRAAAERARAPHPSPGDDDGTASEDLLTATMIVTASATLRFVREFGALAFDGEGLRGAWNAHVAAPRIPHPRRERDAFRKLFDAAANGSLGERDLPTAAAAAAAAAGNATLNIVTEIHQSASLVGLVHTVTRRADATHRRRGNASEGVPLNATGAEGTTNGSATATSPPAEAADGAGALREAASTIERWASNSSVRVSFDLAAAGYIPQVRIAAARLDHSHGLGVATFVTAFDDFAAAVRSGSEAVGAPASVGMRQLGLLEVLQLVRQAADSAPHWRA